MPPVCAKCKQSAPLEGDSWCAACSSWEALGRDLCAHWEVQGCRSLASDLVVNCVRQVRALRNLGAGLSRASVVGGGAPSLGPEAGSHRALPEAPGLSAKAKAASRGAPVREELPRRRSSESRPIKAEVSEPEEDEEAEESEEVPPSPAHRPIIDKGPRPPEPENSPSRDRRRDSGRDRKRSRRDSNPEERRDRDPKPKRRRTGHRGGRKHQRLYRLAVDPTLPVHRKPSEDFWTLTSIAQGDQALHRY